MILSVSSLLVCKFAVVYEGDDACAEEMYPFFRLLPEIGENFVSIIPSVPYIDGSLDSIKDSYGHLLVLLGNDTIVNEGL